MFTAKLELGEYRHAVHRTQSQLHIVMHKGVRDASREGKNRAKQGGRFRNRTGELRGSIKVIKVQRRGKAVWGGYEATAEHASYLEHGTDEHDITPQDRSGGASGRRKGAIHTSGRNIGKRVKNPVFRAGGGKFLRFTIGGQVFFARKVKHPGTSPDPFMKPAMDFAERRAVTTIWRGIEDISVKIWR